MEGVSNYYNAKSPNQASFIASKISNNPTWGAQKNQKIV